jgi:hypothetical protein
MAFGHHCVWWHWRIARMARLKNEKLCHHGRGLAFGHHCLWFHWRYARMGKLNSKII